MSSSDLANMILPTVEWLEYCNRQLFSTESDLLQGDVIFTIQPSTLEGEPSGYFYYGTNGEVICTASTDVLVGSSGIDSVSTPELMSTYDSVVGAAITSTGTAPENIPTLKRKKDSSYFTFTRWVGSSPSLTILTTGTVTAPNIEQLEQEVRLLFEGEWMLGLAFFSEPDTIQYHQGTASDFVAIANSSSDFLSHSLSTVGDHAGIYSVPNASIVPQPTSPEQIQSYLNIDFGSLPIKTGESSPSLVFNNIFLYRTSDNLVAYSASFSTPALLIGTTGEVANLDASSADVSTFPEIGFIKLDLSYFWEPLADDFIII